jgi:cAMP-dependent protein kinase regulator
MDKARLKGIRLFADLDDADLQKIAAFADEKSVAEGDTLVREGDFSEDLIAIEEGTAAVKRGSETVAELGPGDFFGEIGVMKNEMRAATVVATSPMRLITLTHFDLKRMRDMPGVMETISKTAESRN